MLFKWFLQMCFISLFIIFLLLCAYLIGSIPSGYWFAKYYYGLDITKHGSGNIGATNVSRVLGSKKYFLLIFLVDFSKSFLFLEFSKLILIPLGFNPIENYAVPLYLAVFLLIGNGFSIFLNFSGGKAVATSFGILCALAPVHTVAIFLITWILVLLVFKRADVASISAIIITTISVMALGLFFDLIFYPPTTLYIFMSCWIIAHHNKNIRNWLK